MKFFVDTADINDIRDLASTGLLDGVTTNPSLIAKEKVDYGKRLSEICEVVDVEPQQLTLPLINQFVDLRKRNLL